MNGKTKVRLLTANLAKTGSREDKGNFGESRTLQWFERHGINYFRWPQTRETMPKSLARIGGKRPDFAAELGGELVYFDAKFHSIPDLQEFALEVEELQKFSVFREWIRDEFGDEGPRDVVLIVYPQELNGERFVIIHLDELLQGEPTTVGEKPALKVSLLNREETWFDQWPKEPSAT